MNKDMTLQLRLTAKERRRLRVAAKRLGLSASQLVRSMVFARAKWMV